jgi:hypothetical protein
MFDYDPRDYDSRDDERHGSNANRGNRNTSDDRDCANDWRQPDVRSRGNHENVQTLGRGPGSDKQTSAEHGGDRRDDARWTERDRDDREREQKPGDTFARHVHLPRELERELVRDRDRDYTLRGSESRTLATVGAFRVVSSRDRRDNQVRPADTRSGDLRHLREQGLIQTVRVPGTSTSRTRDCGRP